MNLGNRIIKIRKDNKMSQDALAELLNVTRQTVSNWENQKNYPDIETLIKISDKFNISLDILLKGDKKMVKELDKKVKFGKLFKFIIPIIILIIIAIPITSIIVNHSFIAKYNNNFDINLMGDEKGWNLNVNLPSGGLIKGVVVPYKENGEIVNLIFTNVLETVKDRVKDQGWITTIDMNYNSINYNDKMKVYYTMTNLNDIKDKSTEELNKIINNSVLIFNNDKVTTTLICNLNDVEYNYILTYYDGNKQIIDSIGDESFPKNLYLDAFNLDGEYKRLWFPTDKSTHVIEKIDNYFIKYGGNCKVN